MNHREVWHTFRNSFGSAVGMKPFEMHGAGWI